jgi:hypothetical protein
MRTLRLATVAAVCALGTVICFTWVISVVDFIVRLFQLSRQQSSNQGIVDSLMYRMTRR